MIFKIFFALLTAGFSAIGTLIGSYFVRYTNADSMDLAFVFMINSLTMFARPLICAHADRFQSHKSLLCKFLFLTSSSYIPYIGMAYFLSSPYHSLYMSQRTCFWILVVCHLSGCVGFCGVVALGIALAINYAKRVGEDFCGYRKYGSLAYGICGYLLGTVNQGWIIPDFLPTFLTYIIGTGSLVVLIHLWPDEYFQMVTQGADESQLKPLPQGKEIAKIMMKKLYETIWCKTVAGRDDNLERNNSNKQIIECNGTRDSAKNSPNNFATTENSVQEKYLSTRQQLVIFALLIRRDIRVPLYLLLLLYSGLVGYAPQNFVFTYLNQVCHRTGSCDAASLSGLVMFIYCIVEISCFFMIDCLKDYINYTFLLAATLASLTFHYLFYGLILPHVSPYFFVLEALHGIEYSFSLASAVELGYRFGNQVEPLLPELIDRGIIGVNDNHELVKVSLMATMSGSFTLVYDGLGTILGVLLYGVIVEHYSYTTAWIVIGTLSLIGLISVTTIILVGQCCYTRKVPAQANVSLRSADSESGAATIKECVPQSAPEVTKI